MISSSAPERPHPAGNVPGGWSCGPAVAGHLADDRPWPDHHVGSPRPGPLRSGPDVPPGKRRAAPP